MASIHLRKRSPFWYACVRPPAGKPRHFSTGLTDKAEALALATAAERAMRKHLDRPHQLRAALDRLADDFVPAAEENPADWLTAWAISRKGEVADKTATGYTQAATEAGAWMRAAGISTFSAVTPARLVELRNHWSAVTSPGSANKKIKYLRVAMGDAVKAKRISENPAAGLPRLLETATARREFRQDELARLLPTLTGEWRAITLLGLYTGQRLNDLASLRWHQVDMKAKTITFTAEKTGALVALPLMAGVVDALAALPGKRVPADSVLPGILALANSSRSHGFRALLHKVGLATSKHAKKEATGDNSRSTSELSFHSLRHTATTMLKAAGVSDSIARAIVGHESAAVSRAYTHLDLKTMREAMEKMPVAPGA